MLLHVPSEQAKKWELLWIYFFKIVSQNLTNKFLLLFELYFVERTLYFEISRLFIYRTQFSCCSCCCCWCVKLRSISTFSYVECEPARQQLHLIVNICAIIYLSNISRGYFFRCQFSCHNILQRCDVCLLWCI